MAVIKKKKLKKSKIFTLNHKRRSSSSKYHQGMYRVQDRARCINKTSMVEYKSMLELVFLKKVEKKKIFKRWGIETFIIPYKLMGKTRRYFMDFYLEIENKDGSLRRILVETKDDRNIESYQLYKTKGISPKQGRKSASNYKYEIEQFMMNVAKWEATERFVQNHPGFEFYIWGKSDIGAM